MSRWPPGAKKWPESLYAKYPTSIYVGHELARSSRVGYGDIKPFEGNPMEFVAMNPGRRHGNALTLSSKEKDLREAQRHDAWEKTEFVDRVNLLITFLDARPEFSRADMLRLELIGRLAALDRFAEARRQVERLSKTGSTPERRQALESLEVHIRAREREEVRPQIQ